jgi:ParB family chromosome partitioning protein
MSRKNPFAALDIASITAENSPAKPGYGMTGAAKTVVRSIEDLAENAKRLMDGEAIVEIDPGLLDVSFVSDRLSDDDEEYVELKQAIREQGQMTPVLVRPSSADRQRYMVIFGHRRVKVAQELGLKVKAVVKAVDDVTSVIAQGQENSARSNLSFIERAYFAHNLLDAGMSKDVIRSALGADEALLSKMLSVADVVPPALMRKLGACKKIGRDKWLSLRQLLLNPAYAEVAIAFAGKAEFEALPIDGRFDALHAHLKRYKVRSTAKTPQNAASSRRWNAKDNGLSLTMNTKARKVAIELASAEAKPFAEWLSTCMDRLYDEYRRTKNEN